MEIRPSNDPLEIAWAAGLFEGEGCFNAYIRKSGKIQVQARLTMTDQDVVERCPKGHELSGDNLVLEPFTAANGNQYFVRRCREWRTLQGRERARKRLGIAPEHYRIPDKE